MKKIFVLTAVCATIVLLVYLSSCSSRHDDPAPGNSERISYNFQIRPILSDKCFNCHGPDANKREAGLRLDIAAEAYKALKEHPRAHAIVRGNPMQSELFLRVSSKDTSYMMPPASSHLPALTPEEISLFEKWIAQGGQYETHWAFTAPVKKPLPQVQDKQWPKNEIDYFVLDKLEKKHLKPNKEADKERLLKRIAFDITGLPPSPEMTDQFLADNAPNAYEHMIDRLMATPQYGERMAINWMDVARFADSHGYQDDNYRSQWPWRDWVIHAFNNNLSYDKFITWQIAGDLIPNATREQLLATGFNRNHKITEEGGVIDEEYRIEYVIDRTNTLARGILGVSLECARCHDHKYDPFSQKEYYQVTAFFNNITDVGIESTVGGRETYAKNPRMKITDDDLKNALSFIHKPDTNTLEVSVMKDRDTVRPSYILQRGNYDTHGDQVYPGTPASILPFSKDLPPNRLGLSKWLFDPKNPLTARVFVNRLWQEIFGRGLVKSSADFGMQGDLPSHPELLDWLAVDFREHGWDIKRLMKQILLSATYRQSAEETKEKIAEDPENVFLSHAPRIRVPAEMVRDIVLETSGLLNKAIGGPSSKPYQPSGLWEMATSGRGQLATYEQDTGAMLYRRGLYSFIKRTVPPPAMMIFDASNRDQCEVKRSRTNTPLQALIMMNDPTVLESSLALADRLIGKVKASDRVIAGFRKIICRKPEQKEIEILSGYYNDQLAALKSNPPLADKVIHVGNYKPTAASKVELAALMRTLQVIYNMEEAITKT